MPEQDESCLRGILGEGVILMASADVQAELRTIEKSLPAPFSSRHKPTDIELAHAIEAFCSCAFAPFPPSDAALRQKLAQLRASQILPIRYQLSRIDLKLRWLKHACGCDYPPPHLLAVPDVWHRRWESMFGGMLFPAWYAPVLL